MTSRSLHFSACALSIAIAVTDSAAVMNYRQVDLEVQVTRDVSEPQLVFGIALVRNTSDTRVFGWSSVPLDQHRPCSGWRYHYWAMQKSDPRLAPQVAFDMPPGSWFASWQPYWRPGASCELLGEVILTSHAGGQEVAKLSRSAKIPARPERPSLLPSGIEGTLKFETMVWSEEFISHGREPSGDALQLQLLVRNKAPAARTIAITSRMIECDKSSYAFVVGPGAGHPAMTSGPIELSASGWGVLAQRIRGSGDPSMCRYQIVISEMRGTSEEMLKGEGHSPKHWIEVTTVEGRLLPIGKLSYLSY